MTDLASGRYPGYEPFWNILGQRNNEVQANVPVRTNLNILKYSTCEDGALAATEVGCGVAVPVQNGDVFTKATILVGATASKELEHSWIALYEGKAKGKLLAQSKDLTADITASKAFTVTLESKVQANSENAPFGFLYAVINVAAPTGVAGVIQTTVATPCPKLAQDYEKKEPWFTGGPLGWGFTVGSGLKATAKAELETTTSKANVPWIFLT
jgi:hypothetical protein